MKDEIDKNQMDLIIKNNGDLKKSASGSWFLDSMREQMKEIYTPEYMKGKLDEFLNAEDEFASQKGMIIRRKNWGAREYGFDKVLDIYGLRKGLEEKGEGVPTKITIIVNGEEKKVEIKAEDKKKEEVIEIKEKK